MTKIQQTKKKFHPTKLIANLLIIFGIGLLLFIYIPFLKLLIPSAPIQIKSSLEFTIMIPSINAESKIIESVDPWDKDLYQKALEKGVAHAKNTSLPGENGTIFLFAHSSDVPWRITRTNTPFMKLPLLKVGDTIYLSREDKTYEYQIVEKKTVSPYDVSFLEDTQSNRLILQTCTPPGTDWKRLLVFAELKEN